MSGGGDEPGLPEGGISQIKFADLKIEETIGEGNYGDVHRGRYLDIDVAVKEIVLDDLDMLKYIKREIRILAAMRHPFILQFLGVCEDRNQIYIVTEYLRAGDVSQLLESTKEVTWRLRLSIGTQLCQAMIYLHSKNVIHRDLKCDNVLLDEHNNIRLADFGLARVLEVTSRDRALTICGTDGFIAPEVMLGMQYTPACDVFSYGMCLAQLATRKEPGDDFWDRGDSGDFGLDTDEFTALLPSDCPSEFKDLTLGCVAFDMEDRPQFGDILDVLKYINGNIAGARAGGGGRRRGGGTPALVGTLSRSTLRKNNLSYVTDSASSSLRSNAINSLRSAVSTLRSSLATSSSSVATTRGGAAAAAAAATVVVSDELTVEDKSAQMLLFHVMKLVQRSTNEDFSDQEYVADFLLSYRLFLSPPQLLLLLFKRYHYDEPLDDDASDEEKAVVARKQKLIQLRTLIFIKMWIQKYHHDFGDDDDNNAMVVAMRELDKVVEATGARSASSSSLSSLLAKKREEERKPKPTPVFNATAPSTIACANTPKTMKDVDCVELARQITLKLHANLSSIQPRDLLGEVWKRQKQGATNNFLLLCARLTKWCRASILGGGGGGGSGSGGGGDGGGGDSASALATIEHLMAVAVELRKLQNYAAMFAVVSALTDPNVTRLEKTLSRLSEGAKRELESMKALMANDMRGYKLLPKTPPAVPHLQRHLDEIVYIESSSPARLANGIINFRRHRGVGRAVRELEAFQVAPYNLTRVDELSNFIENSLKLAERVDDEAAKRLSLQVEAPM